MPSSSVSRGVREWRFLRTTRIDGQTIREPLPTGKRRRALHERREAGAIRRSSVILITFFLCLFCHHITIERSPIVDSKLLPLEASLGTAGAIHSHRTCCLWRCRQSRGLQEAEPRVRRCFPAQHGQQGPRIALWLLGSIVE